MEAAIKTRILLGQETTECAKPILFKEWARTYLSLEEVKSLRSFVGRSHSVEMHLIPFFGGKLLSEIKPQDIEVFRSQRKKSNGAPASVQTINHDHIALKHCLNVAIRRGLLQSNPASKIPLPNPHNERDRVLTDEEWGRLYRAAKGHLGPVLLTAYQLGQRFSEIVGLTWDRVDVKRGFITLRSLDTKTKTARQVPITPDVKMILQRLARYGVLPQGTSSRIKADRFSGLADHSRPLSGRQVSQTSGSTTCATVPRRTSEGQGWTRQRL